MLWFELNSICLQACSWIYTLNLLSSAWCINAALYPCHARRVCGGWGFHWQPVWMGVSSGTVGQHRRRIELDMGWCHQRSARGRFLTHGDIRGQNTFTHTHTSAGQWTWLMSWSRKPAGCLCQRLQLRHYTLISSVWPLAQEGYHPESFRSHHSQKHSALPSTSKSSTYYSNIMLSNTVCARGGWY